MLQNDYLVAKIGVDTAENSLSEVAGSRPLRAGLAAELPQHGLRELLVVHGAVPVPVDLAQKVSPERRARFHEGSFPAGSAPNFFIPTLIQICACIVQRFRYLQDFNVTAAN